MTTDVSPVHRALDRLVPIPASPPEPLRLRHCGHPENESLGLEDSRKAITSDVFLLNELAAHAKGVAA
jgi:hypothetical protein